MRGISRRLARRRSGWVWMLPAIAVAFTLSLDVSALSRLTLSDADYQVAAFGGRDTSVQFNEMVPTTDASFDFQTTVSELGRTAGAANVCVTLNSYLKLAPSDQTYLGYREFLDGCSPEDFGFALTAGRWPAAPGEVVASAASGVAVDQQIAGVTPQPLSVVGIVDNPRSMRSQVVIGYSGTWRSWDWPTAAARYPRLSATVTGYVTAADPVAVQNRYLAEPTGSASVQSLRDERSTPRDDYPFLYDWVAIPLMALAVGISLSLRRRFVTDRSRLLIDQGVAPSRAAAVLTVSIAMSLIPAVVLGIVAGWSLAWAITPPLTWVAGYVPAPVQAPWDPLLRLTATLIGIVGLWAAIRRVAARRSGAPARRPSTRRRTGRRLSALALVVVAMVAAPALRDPTTLFIAVLLILMAFGLLSPDIVSGVSRRLPQRSPVPRLASRRLASPGSPGALVAASTALTVGLVIAMTTILSSTIANDNARSRLPPRQDQATYSLSEDEMTNAAVRSIVAEVTNDEATTVILGFAEFAPDRAVTATERGLGTVFTVPSIGDLEDVLGEALSADAARVLNSGGVLWNSSNSGSTVWARSGDGSTPVQLTAGFSMSFDPRWSTESSGFILESTARENGLNVVPRTAVFNEVDQASSDALSPALEAAGYDRAIITTFRPNDPYTISPFQIGVLSILGGLGIGLILSATRAGAAQLTRQSAEMIALGASGSWLARVFVIETAVALGIGVAGGALVSLAVTAFGITAAGLTTDVPYGTMTIFFAGLAVAIAVVCASAFRSVYGERR